VAGCAAAAATHLATLLARNGSGEGWPRPDHSDRHATTSVYGSRLPKRRPRPVPHGPAAATSQPHHAPDRPVPLRAQVGAGGGTPSASAGRASPNALLPWARREFRSSRRRVRGPRRSGRRWPPGSCRAGFPGRLHGRGSAAAQPQSRAGRHSSDRARPGRAARSCDLTCHAHHNSVAGSPAAGW